MLILVKMNVMKFYCCKICKSRGKHFSGTRHEVRHHVRHEHLIKSSKLKTKIEDKHKSSITPYVISEEF